MKSIPVTCGAEALIRALIDEGVDVIFGLPGGANLPIMKALQDAPIRFILARHEQGAIHMAQGYARASGRVGVCLVTSGPGATNAITGIADAFMDSTPVVTITGQVATEKIGNDAFQEVDTTGLTCTITKHNYLLRNAADAPRVVKEAFYVASTGRPGPVLIDVPVDVAKAPCDYLPAGEVKIRGYAPTYDGHPEQIRKAAELIAKAERPVILAGQGALLSDASEELLALAEKTRIPVTTTLLGLGAFPENNPLSLKMPGMHGTKYACYALHNADLIVGVGARFDDRVAGKPKEFAPGAKIVHIDIDPTSIRKTVRCDVPIIGDAKRVLRELNKIVKAPSIDAWHKQIAEWKRLYPLHWDDANPKDGRSFKHLLSDGEPWPHDHFPKRTLKPQFVIRAIDELTKGEAIITADVGQHQMWSAQLLTHSRPRSFITSGGLGTMGYSYPAALGAKVACPDRTVININGDGSFQMTCQELAVAHVYKIPVKCVIINNGCLGMVRQWQEIIIPGAKYKGVILEGCPDFVKLAEAYGALGIRVDKKEDVRPALERMLKHPGPVVVDMVVSIEENCYPMVPGGRNLNEVVEHDPKPKEEIKVDASHHLSVS